MEESGRKRRRSGKSSSGGKAAALAALKERKQAGWQDVDAVYDVVTEEQFAADVNNRLAQKDFIEGMYYT